MPNQLPFIIDTCFSGEAAVPAGTVQAEIMHQTPPAGKHVWVRVLTSCLAVETARDGLFGRRVRMLLDRGPGDAGAAGCAGRRTASSSGGTTRVTRC